MARPIVVRDLKDGEVLLPEGASDSNMHVVASGAISVAKKAEGGTRTTRHLLGLGDPVGELSFMDDTPHFAALVATGPTREYSLSREKLETLLDTHPRRLQGDALDHVRRARDPAAPEHADGRAAEPLRQDSRPPLGWRRTGRVRHVLA